MAKKKVFISWSGTKAGRVAEEMRGFLSLVLPNSLIWFSGADISAGDRWSIQLASELDTTDYGVICVTHESLESKWVAFEAGAMGKSINSARVCPYLVDLEQNQLEGPLSLFQSASADEHGTRRLVESINRVQPSDALSEQQLRSYFDAFWPPFASKLSEINEDLRPLPLAVQNRLLSVLPPAFYRQTEIESLILESGVSPWLINFGQAAVHTWREAIRVAADEKVLGNLVNHALERAPVLEDRLSDVRDQLTPWTTQRA